MTGDDGLRAANIGQRANLTDDPREEVRREMVFRLFQREESQRGNTQGIVAKPIDSASDNLALQIENGRSQREIEKRLLAIAQGVKTSLLPVRSLLKYDCDLVDDFFEPSTDQTEAGFPIDRGSRSQTTATH